MQKVKEGQTRKRGLSVVAQTAGIFKTNTPALTAEEERVMAEEAIAQDVMERMNNKRT